MKPETNKHIDLLLQRMGRRDGEAASGAADNRHLDADELSSYAQNALPAAARARYTEHLAECVSCRKLVTELSLSLGTASVTAPVEAMPAAGGLKKFLASLFSPLVLRYAVPALGVLVVMIVGFVVLRQQKSHDLMVTANRQAAQPIPVTVASPQGDQAPIKESRVAEQVESANGNLKPTEAKPKPASVSNEADGAGSSAPVTATKDARPADAQPSAAPPPAPAEAVSVEAKPAEIDAVAKKQPDEAKVKDQEVAKLQPKARQTTSGLFQVEPNTAKRAEENKPKAEPSETSGFIGGARAGTRERAATRRTADTKRVDEKRAQDNDKQAQANEANEETKTIAGRRFRKERGIWIDTAYDSSTATINMGRDSEQFRALVADEPAIGTIAKQLEGEVIVVWKTRAYHIR